MARTLFAPIGTGALLAVIAALTLTGPAWAAINVPSDGSDGVFNPTASIEVDLSQAVTGTWSDNNSANAGKGIYDPQKWAVVFKYSSVDIPAGVTVTFKNHPSGAPVVWLVQTSATIAGIVNLNGKNGENSGSLIEAGPGGFRGGAGKTSFHVEGSGYGPGGGGQPVAGCWEAAGGSYGEKGTAFLNCGLLGPVYGNEAILPIIGGSGGTGHNSPTYDGSGGGGALLLCAGTVVTVQGVVKADGGKHPYAGSGGGSGGAIRVIAETVSGNGSLSAKGGQSGSTGGDGRIRIECNTLTYSGSHTPTASTLIPLLTDPVIWPPANIPAITIVQIAGENAPADPHAVLSTSEHYTTLDVSPATPVVVRMHATNVPLDWNVVLRVVPTYGKDINLTATKVSGDALASVWEATITAPKGISAIQARASKP